MSFTALHKNKSRPHAPGKLIYLYGHGSVFALVLTALKLLYDKVGAGGAIAIIHLDPVCLLKKCGTL